MVVIHDSLHRKVGDNVKIIILGDSLALPRPHRIKDFNPEIDKELAVHFEDTYGFLLEKELRAEYPSSGPTVMNRAQRFSTMKDIANQFSDHLFYFQPDVIVIQVGIVDCWFRDELGGKQLVNVAEFEQYYRYILTMLQKRPETKLIVVGICPTSMKMEKRYPGLLRQIQLYNQVLKSGENQHQVFFVEMESYINSHNPHIYLLPDDHHLNKQGHVLVFKQIFKIVTAFIENILGCNAFDKNVDLSYKHFIESFSIYPNYGDNLYNLIYLSYLLQDWAKTIEYIKFVREHHIQHPSLHELVSMVKEQMNS